MDANLTEIVEAFRCRGCSVHVTNDAWDLTVGYSGISMLIEVKDGKKPPSARKLTAAQRKFRQAWTGGIRLVKSLDDVEITIATLQRWRSKISST